MYLGYLILEVANVCFEVVGGFHLDGEEVMVVLLELLAGRVSRNNLVRSPKTCIDRSKREWNQSEASSFKLEGNNRHKIELFREWITILSSYWRRC